jgi:hypothetical protein
LGIRLFVVETFLRASGCGSGSLTMLTPTRPQPRPSWPVASHLAPFLVETSEPQICRRRVLRIRRLGVRIPPGALCVETGPERPRDVGGVRHIPTYPQVSALPGRSGPAGWRRRSTHSSARAHPDRRAMIYPRATTLTEHQHPNTNIRTPRKEKRGRHAQGQHPKHQRARERTRL